MKKLSFIMAIIMIVMTFPMMFMTTASADAPTDPTVVGKNPADGYQKTEEDTASGQLCLIITGEGEEAVKTYYASIEDAIAAAADGDTIYVLMSKEIKGADLRWKTMGREITIDFLGNTLTYTGSSIPFRTVYNADYDAAGASDPDSGFTIKNAKLYGPTISQVNSYVYLNFENCYIETTSSSYGFTIQQDYSTVKLINSYYLCKATKYSGNSQGGAFTNWGGDAVTTIVENSYVYSPGTLVVTPDGAARGDGHKPYTFVAKNSTLETGYQNAFVLMSNDMSIDLDNCNVNVYTNGREASEADKGTLVWQHNNTHRTKVSVKNSNIVVNDMLDSTYVICKDGAADKTLGCSYTITNTNVTANGGNLFDLAGDVDVVIDGGTYITDGRVFYGHKATDAVNQARITILGGQFLTRNHTANLNSFNGLTPLSGAIMVSNGASFDIYGGTFALYQDSNSVLNTTAPIIFCWGGAANLVKVYGGTFIGGCGMMARVTSTGNESDPIAEAKVYAYEDGKTSVEIAPSVKKGASIRLDAKSGLRFSSDINAWTVNYVATELAKEGTAVEYGTMITRSSYLKYTSGEFTMAAFDAKGMTSRYINVVAKDGIVKNADGSVTIHAALVDIDADNYQKDFVAISYIKYTNANDEVAYIYAGNVSLAENSRNIEEVALAALADVQTKAGGAYTNAVSEYYVYNMAARKYELVKSTAYSAYTADQIKALQSYIVVAD